MSTEILFKKCGNKNCKNPFFNITKGFLPSTQFGKDSHTKTGFRSRCKLCEDITLKNYRIKNKEKIAKYKKEFYNLNKNKILKHKKEYDLLHREEISIKHQNYILKDKEKWTNYRRNYEKIRYHNDIGFRLTKVLRLRLRRAIKSYLSKKIKILKCSINKDLGCPIPELIKHLESKFQLGMNWDNYGFGKGKWNIDHIKALSNFDLTDIEQQKQAVHYTNLQPLWHEENIRKSNKF